MDFLKIKSFGNLPKVCLKFHLQGWLPSEWNGEGFVISYNKKLQPWILGSLDPPVEVLIELQFWLKCRAHLLPWVPLNNKCYPTSLPEVPFLGGFSSLPQLLEATLKKKLKRKGLDKHRPVWLAKQGWEFMQSFSWASFSSLLAKEVLMLCLEWGKGTDDMTTHSFQHLL